MELLDMKISNLWTNLSKEKFSDIDENFINSFREPGKSNSRLGAWDAFDPTMRYFKFLLLNASLSKSSEFFLNYQKIGNTNLGNPINIKVLIDRTGQDRTGQDRTGQDRTGQDRTGQDRTILINIDHFLSIEEYTFLLSGLGNSINQISSIVEIGAGFGRTAQAIIKLIDNVNIYFIIDIPEMLVLSEAYLKKILTLPEFKKLRFISCFEKFDFPTIDLVINIDSFQEMPKETIYFYFQKIILKTKYFYSKNPIGKYDPKSIGIIVDKLENINEVFSLGLSNDILDIFDEDQLSIAREKYMETYKPSQEFKIIHHYPLDIFPYYHNVLYERNSI